MLEGDTRVSSLLGSWEILLSRKDGLPGLVPSPSQGGLIGRLLVATHVGSCHKTRQQKSLLPVRCQVLCRLTHRRSLPPGECDHEYTVVQGVDFMFPQPSCQQACQLPLADLHPLLAATKFCISTEEGHSFTKVLCLKRGLSSALT